MFMPFRQTATLSFWKTLQNMEITIPAGTRTPSGAVTKRTVTRKIGPYLRMGYAQDEETPWITLYRGKTDRKVRYPYDEVQIRGLTDELVFGEIRSFIQGTDNRSYVDQLYSMIELMRPGTLREAAVHYVNEYHRNVSTTRAIFFFEDVDRFTLRDSPYSDNHSYIPCIHMARHATTVRFFHHTYCVPDLIPQMQCRLRQF